MDFAYDHITEENLPRHQTSTTEEDRAQTPTQSSTSGHNRHQSLSSEFDEAYKTIQSTAWGARFGAIFETVKKQGEVYYDATKHEYATRSEQAQKGWTGLREAVVTRSRALSTDQPPTSIPEATEDKGESSASGEKAGEAADTAPAAGTLLSRLRAEAMKGLTEVQKAEDAADAYLAKFGTNLGNFLKDAVTIAPPSDSDDEAPVEKGKEKQDVLFETKGSEESKRPIHTTRLDASLHLLHSNLDNFKSDPKSPKYKAEWVATFSAEKMTEQIGKDLEQYPELRSSMEKLVPGTVPYEEFWKRYYFLRAELDAEEQKRKELLKVAAKEEEEVGWEEDSDDDDDDEEDDDEEDDDSEEESSEEDTKKPAASAGKAIPKPSQKVSTDTLRAKSKPADIMSQPDSEASYDVVSGAPSNASGSPPKRQSKQDDSDEEDWE
ncbi:hypothetical protein ABW19_dt0201187 [Dactylella cylindrospora]|nr:hypothetical protein ABW19_dt0201187 [Dactylella cylindrospora]